MKAYVGVLAALALSGCVTTEVAEFKPQAGQETIVRDGNPALISKKAHSVVMVRPALREMPANGRPVYVVAVYNAGAEPVLLSTSNITVEQLVGGEAVTGLKVMSYTDLVQEERSRQVLAAVAAGAAAAGNSMAAQNAGYYNSRSTVYGPGGSATVYTSGYSPTAAAIAQSNASAQNAAMFANVAERGQQNLNALEQQVLKDNTVMPGQWVGGQVYIAPPAKTEGGKDYRLIVVFGGDVHQVEITQKAAGG